MHRSLEVVSGVATDALAESEEWVHRNGLPVHRFPSDWRRHGRAAGPIRNRLMAEYADAVALFPSGRGIANPYSEALRSGISIIDWCGSDAYA
jgi:hypothetical protein